MSPAPAKIEVFRHHAMATTFEVHVAGQPGAYARQASGAAFSTLDRLEGLLSRFQESSEISCINQLPPGASLRVSADTLECLGVALRMHSLTGGAFDPTLGRHTGEDAPASGEPKGRLELDPDAFMVTVRDAPVSLDLGAIGKGFALDRMADVLGEWGVAQALLVGGGSSILALERPEGSAGWDITLGSGPLRHHLWLEHLSVGSSGTSVKGQHILDPLTLRPPNLVHRTWALCDRAAESDALSTAWMCLSREEIGDICGSRPRTGALLQPEAGSKGLVVIGFAREFVPES